MRLECSTYFCVIFEWPQFFLKAQFNASWIPFTEYTFINQQNNRNYFCSQGLQAIA